MKKYLQASLFVLLLGMLTVSAQADEKPSDSLNELLQKHYAAYGVEGDPAATFAQTTAADWQNCSSNGDSCQTRDQLAEALGGLHKLIPDLKWEILDTLVSGDKVIIRGQGSGTPAGEFMGIPATGKSFKVMSIDIHTLSDGKISHTYHLEDWAAAMQQLSGH
ncbi:ester cyclase [Candidatus Thiothrix sp. Deng01]|uniref:Ester cyclase n=1 Tax=Candidatus Thiothrix phosphatis TaxID=3112415 RepID=A0ABU6D3C6_9GAMM|nr:ester cyclase [Candidatus Thiothrix sp. Deng01]MEB4593579.1 ester cyclase [Candidatus Thiothrix sp. Deng01]